MNYLRPATLGDKAAQKSDTKKIDHNAKIINFDRFPRSLLICPLTFDLITGQVFAGGHLPLIVANFLPPITFRPRNHGDIQV